MSGASDIKPFRPVDWTQEKMDHWINHWKYQVFDSNDRNPSCQDGVLESLRKLEEELYDGYKYDYTHFPDLESNDMYYYRISSLRHIRDMWLMSGRNPDYFLEYLTY